MKIVQKILLGLAIIMPGLSMAPALVLADTKGSVICGVNGAAGQACSTPKDTGSLDKTAKAIINFLAILVGVAAVIMIIIAGLKYIASGGNAEKVKSAKNTLIYAIIGLVLVALAETIVHFVLTEANNPSTTSLMLTSFL
jgi:cytochrome bd-type quinol oxidase subunit 2